MRLLSLLFASLIPLIAHAERLNVTPYRPTISNPAELSAFRHLEVEFGAQSNQTGMQVERNSLPFLLKSPFADQWGLLVGGEAWIKSRNTDETIYGFGNTSVLLKHYSPINPTLAVGFEAGTILPSARPSLEQGRTDYWANLIVSQDISDLRIDVNAGVTRRGFKEEDLERFRYNWAIAALQMITLGRCRGILRCFSQTTKTNESIFRLWLKITSRNNYFRSSSRSCRACRSMIGLTQWIEIFPPTLRQAQGERKNFTQSMSEVIVDRILSVFKLFNDAPAHAGFRRSDRHDHPNR